MAGLLGNKIKDTYSGLLKTEDNGAIGTSAINLTDGLGNQTGLSLNLGANLLQFERGNVEYSLKNSNFTRANYPMGPTAGDASYLNFTDSNGAYTGWLSLDRYGSMYYTNTHGDQGEGHVFVSQTGAGAYAPATIRIDTYDSVNNSNNWYLGYQQSLSGASFNSGTGDLTLSRQDSTDVVVNIPTGGGSAGLVNGTGSDSLKNADSLVTTPAEATQANTITLGSGAKAYSSGVIAIGQSSGSTGTSHWGSVSIGNNTSVGGFGAVTLGANSSSTGNSSIAIGDTAEGFGTNSIAIGQNAETIFSNSIAIGSVSRTTTYYGMAIGVNARAFGNYSFAMQNNAYANGEQAISIGYNTQALGARNIAFGASNRVQAGNNNTIFGGVGNTIPSGDKNLMLGTDALSMPATKNDNIAIGRVSSFGTSSNAIAFGLVASIGNSCDNSTAIGRGATVADNTTYAVALGDVTATRSRHVTGEQFEATTLGGGIVMYSPDGTAYRLTIANGGTVSISAA